MNKDTAKDYLPLVQALAEGKTIQKFSDGDGWEEVVSPNFASPAKLYRIKPEQKKGWYRVLLVKNNVGRFYTATVDCEISEKEWIKDSRFIDWLGDRIEYELPEGDA